MSSVLTGIAFVFLFSAVLFGQTNGDKGAKTSMIASSRSTSDERIIEQFFAAWNSHDADKIAAAFDEDGIYEDVTAGHTNHGRAEVRTWAEGAFVVVQNFKMEIVNSSIQKHRGVVEWVWSGTDKGLLKTGKNFSVRGVSVIELKKGKIYRYKEYYDFAAIMRQVGVLPPERK
jgi:steroid delta-isomerase-like uncharacterized protein